MFGNIGELKKMFDNYKKLQKSLENTIIRSREWGVMIDISAAMKVRDVKIEDDSLLNPSMKETLEENIKKAIIKAQEKAQQVAMEKTKEVLGFDPNDLASMMGGMWGGKLPF